jgi:hypothetical protein
MIRHETPAGTSIGTVCELLVSKAKESGESVTTNFNGVEITALPASLAEDLVSYYWRVVNARPQPKTQREIELETRIAELEASCRAMRECLTALKHEMEGNADVPKM